MSAKGFPGSHPTMALFFQRNRLSILPSAASLWMTPAPYYVRSAIFHRPVASLELMANTAHPSINPRYYARDIMNETFYWRLSMKRLYAAGLTLSAMLLLANAAHPQVKLNSVRIAAKDTVALAKFYQTAF